MKLFVLLSRVPYPIEKGDKLRAFHQLRCLSRDNQVVLCALNDAPLHPDAVKILSSFCTGVHIVPINKVGMVLNLVRALFSGKPFQVGYFYRSKAQRAVDKLIAASHPDHIFCQLIRVAEYVRHSPIPKTLDYQDIFSMGAKRRAETSSFFLRMFFRLEYKRLLRYEHDVFADFDHKTMISLPDRQLLPHPLRDQVVIVPNGVDHQFFSPMDKPKEYDIVFTGNMGYAPNVDAALFIAEAILPLVLAKLPHAKLLLAGATPHPKVAALQSDSITVTGWVDDIRQCYASSRIFIAPMRIGTGLQNKLLEAMAMRLPCITSALANEALGAAPDKEILLGSSTQEYSDHLIRLLTDPQLADALAAAGQAYVQRVFNWQNTAAQLQQLFQNSKTNPTI